VAWLVGSRSQNIAFTQNTSFGISIAANGLDWRAGDNVVLPGREFPSNFYPWKNLAYLGVHVRTVPAPLGHAAIDDIAGAIDDRTRAVAVSAVQFSNGHRYDLGRIGDLREDRGMLFIVDGTQSVGALTIDVAAAGVDLLAVSSHKWMLGPPGIGFAHISDRAFDQLRAPVVGWLSVSEPFAFDYRLDLAPTAERFEPGTENVVAPMSRWRTHTKVPTHASAAAHSNSTVIGLIVRRPATAGAVITPPRRTGSKILTTRHRTR
jgi:cysteine desulfurase / selenocysteine lyase